MSIGIIKFLYCDGPLCTDGRMPPIELSYNFDITATEQRKSLREQGWRVSNHGKDYCPECLKVMKQPLDSEANPLDQADSPVDFDGN